MVLPLVQVRLPGIDAFGVLPRRPVSPTDGGAGAVGVRGGTADAATSFTQVARGHALVTQRSVSAVTRSGDAFGRPLPDRRLLRAKFRPALSSGPIGPAVGPP